MQVDPRRPQAQRQDTFDLREQILAGDDHHAQMQAHADAAAAAASYHNDTDEEHSVLEDDSDGEEREEYIDDEEEDRESSLSIPNESIDFDLVYSLHSFAATVEGQANVVKGDSLFLMDDSNSYWWLVRVLKTQEVGYIPAENIETPFERLARLNKHRNVDLASATQAELQDGLSASQDRLRLNLSSRSGSHSNSPSPSQFPAKKQGKGVVFTSALSVHRYPPAIWNALEGEEEEDVEWDDGEYTDHDHELALEIENEERQRLYEAKGKGAVQQMPGGMSIEMEEDDGMQWDDMAAEEMQRQAMARQEGVPEALQPSSSREQQQQQMLRMQQQQQMEAQMAQQKEAQLQAQMQAQAQAQQQAQQAQQQAQQQQGTPASLRSSASRERLVSPAPGQDAALSVSPAPGQRRIDPAEVTETKKLTATPSIAQDQDGYAPNQAIERQREEREKREREAEEEEARKRARASASSPGGSMNGKSSPAPSGRMGTPASNTSSVQQQQQQRGKLRKDPAGRDRGAESEDENGKKKKSGGVFGSLFRRKDKDGKDKEKSREREKGGASMGSVESGDVYASRQSEESGRSGRPSVTSSAEMGALSPTTSQAMQAQQASAMRSPQSIIAPVTPERPSLSSSISSSPSVSQHANSLRQRDQQQQQLYQQYLNRSPSGAPEASYGLQSASAVLGQLHGSPLANSSSSPGGLGPPAARPRPGSLIISPGDGQGPGVPELSVIRVFQGKHLQTEATFKTVLLNSSTTATDLVKQAIQRFRLPAGEDENDYYLTVKQVEGGASAVLRPNEKPLLVFETLVNDAQMDVMMPKVKRSSVGSISSVVSNLSMHPAIRKLSMNDFSDDSAVKFYLNRKAEGPDDSALGHDGEEGDETLIAETSFGAESTEANLHSPPGRNAYLSVNTQANVTPERFSSPSFRFPLQLVIYPDDLPDDMIFHPLTEAIVFKHTLRDSDVPQSSASTGVSMHWRRKVFMFPKNVTVAEVTELGLERFGILEGVVDGGDEVEDKLAKRRSSARVRYGLFVEVPGQPERELTPSSRVVEAFPRPPSFRATDRNSASFKRRSVDSAHLLGTVDDVSLDDPVFILRRAISYRNSTSRHRMSAPLDEIALQRMQNNRESTQNSNRESASSAYSSDQPQANQEEGSKLKQPSRQEIIAAQRAVTRANQRAILSAQTNSVRGMDVLLPGNAILRSSRYDASDKMRYSYVEPDGESYDISDIVEEEWRDQGREKNQNRDDLLEGVVRRGGGDKIDRVLNKIRERERGKGEEKEVSSIDSSRLSQQSGSGSEYSDDGPALSGEELATPGGLSMLAAAVSAGRTTPTAATRSTSPGVTSQERRSISPNEGQPQQERSISRPGTTTPTAKPAFAPTNRRHPSLASVVSDMSGYETPPTHAPSPSFSAGTGTQDNPQRARDSPQRLRDSPQDIRDSPQSMRERDITPSNRGPTPSSLTTKSKKVVIPKDDFGIDQMMAIIECRAQQSKPQKTPARREPEPEKDIVEEMLFGPTVDLESLHPGVRDIYKDGFDMLQEIDKFLDVLVPPSAVSAGSA